MGIIYSGTIGIITQTDPTNPNNCRSCEQTLYECRCLGFDAPLKVTPKSNSYWYLNDLEV